MRRFLIPALAVLVLAGVAAGYRDRQPVRPRTTTTSSTRSACGATSPTGTSRPTRRAEPDRRHERPGARVHGPRRRPEGRQRPDGQPAERQLRRRALRAGARLVQRARRSRPCSRRATTTGRTATGRRTAASTRSSGSTTSGGVLLDAVLARQEAAEAGRADRRRPAWAWTAPTACVENRRWTFKDVTYATLNVQGSCNNLCDTAPEPGRVRRAQRREHRLARRGFAEATASDSAAVMLISQADPGFDGSDGTRAPLRDPRTLAETDANSGPLDGYQSFLVDLRDLTIAFRKPVVLRATATRTTSASTSRSRTPRAGARELHPRRDLRRQRAQRPERRALGEGARRPEEPRRVRVPAADRAREPGRRTRSLTGGRHPALRGGGPR